MLTAPLFGQWNKTTWGMKPAEVAAVAGSKIEIGGLVFKVAFVHDAAGGLDKVKLTFDAKSPLEAPGCGSMTYKLLVDKYGEPEKVKRDQLDEFFDNHEWLTPSTRIVASRNFCIIEYAKRINTEGL